MDKVEKLNRDIATILETIELDWLELSQRNMSMSEAAGIRDHVKICIKKLSDLLGSLPTA
jgi:hypothetical protein